MISDSNPVFVKIEKYKDIVDIIDVIDKKIGTVKQTLIELGEIKAKEDQEIRNWEKNIEDIGHKLTSIKDDLSL